MSDTDREAEMSRELRARRRLNNISDLEAGSFGDTRAQGSACLQLLGEQPLSSACLDAQITSHVVKSPPTMVQKVARCSFQSFHLLVNHNRFIGEILLLLN